MYMCGSYGLTYQTMYVYYVYVISYSECGTDEPFSVQWLKSFNLTLFCCCSRSLPCMYVYQTST